MPLVDLDLPVGETALPGDVRAFLREADRRIEQFQRDARVPGFVPSDFAKAYRVLRTLAAERLAPRALFCEWGSGFGVVACLAAMLDLDACGIEIEADLVDAAQQLAADFDLPVEFIRGSFIPRDAQTCAAEEYTWLTTEGSDGHAELGLDPEDFGIIFAYPWPDEEELTFDLFEQFAAPGALLVTYHGGEDFRLRQKIGGKPRRGR